MTTAPQKFPPRVFVTVREDGGLTHIALHAPFVGTPSIQYISLDEHNQIIADTVNNCEQMREESVREARAQAQIEMLEECATKHLNIHKLGNKEWVKAKAASIRKGETK